MLENTGYTSDPTVSSSGSSPTFTSSGKHGGGAFFDGSNDAMQISGVSSTTFSACFWTKPVQHNPAGRSYILDSRSGGGSGYWLYDTGDTMTIWTTSGEYRFNFKPDWNSWQHWCLTGDGSKSRFYVNGVLFTSAPNPPKCENQLTLGTYYGVYGGSGQYFMHATIDDFYLSSETLSIDEIQDLMTLTNLGTGPTNSLLYASYAAGYGGSSIFVHDGDAAVPSVYSSSSAPTIGVGLNGQGLDFNGNDQAIRIPSPDPSNGWSVCMWMKIRSHNSIGRTYFIDARQPDSGFYWLIDSNNMMTLKGQDGEVRWDYTPVMGDWNHFCLTSGSNSILWRNGVVEKEIQGTLPVGSNLHLGTYNGRWGGSGNYFFNGVIDNVVVMYKTLSSVEVVEMQGLELS